MLLVHSVEEVVHPHTEFCGESPQPTGGDAILPNFVFVHLLRRDPNRLSQLLLSDAQDDPPLAQPGSNVAIYVR